MSLPYPLDYQNLLQSGPQGPVTVGGRYPLRGDTYSGLIVSELMGKYAELVRLGYVFSSRATAAGVIPSYATLTNAPTLFNRSSSGKMVYPLFVTMTPGSTGATAGDFVTLPFGLIFLTGCGDAPATGAPIASGTALTTYNTCVGGGATPSTQYMATTAFTASTTQAVAMDLFFNNTVLGTAAATSYVTYTSQHFDGSVALKPGTSLVLAVSSTTTGGTATKTYNVNWVWAELPYQTGYGQ